jgi:hypothetical protein
MKIPPCGAYCNSCPVYKKRCAGCIETKGNPLYLKDSGKDVCPVWKCAIEHKVEHCGLCKEFPCDMFLNWYDPKRGIVTALRRAGLLALRKKIGTDAWIKWIEDKKIEFGV